MIMSVISACAADDLRFPFNQKPHIQFFRYNSETGTRFQMRQVKDQWEVENSIGKPKPTKLTEKITDEKADEILRAFSSLYDYWNNQPEMS